MGIDKHFEGVDKESADGMNNSSSPSCWIVIDGVSELKKDHLLFWLELFPF